MKPKKLYMFIRPQQVQLSTIVLCLLLAGCGDTVFEALMFAPATPLHAEANACDHFPAGYSCADIDFEEIFFSPANESIPLQALFFRNPESDKLLIYFHGNAGNIYYRQRFALPLTELTNVLLLSYRGYGKSYGKPSEQGLYLDGQAAIRYARETLGFEKKKIILYGRSMGTAVAIDAARNNRVGGLILISPFSSGYDLAVDRGLQKWPGLNRPFDSINKVASLRTPVFIIHGDQDRLVPIEHSRRLFAAYPGKQKQFIEIRGATHWNVVRSFRPDYWTQLSEFINQAN